MSRVYKLINKKPMLKVQKFDAEEFDSLKSGNKLADLRAALFPMRLGEAILIGERDWTIPVSKNNDRSAHVHTVGSHMGRKYSFRAIKGRGYAIKRVA